MKQLVACTLGFLISSATIAAPARPLYEPPATPTPPAPIALGGTYWAGKCYADNFWIIFERDGSLTYGYNQNSFKNGTWQMTGERMYFEMNKKYLEFNGTIQGGIIQGEAVNVQGGRWRTHLAIVPEKAVTR